MRTILDVDVETVVASGPSPADVSAAVTSAVAPLDPQFAAPPRLPAGDMTAAVTTAAVPMAAAAVISQAAAAGTPSYADAIARVAAGSCGCPTCGGVTGAAASSLATPLAATLAQVHSEVRGAEMLPQVANGDGTYSFSGDRNIDAILIGSRWTSATLTFTFPTDGSYADPSYGAGQLPFNAVQQAAARAAFKMVQDVTGLVITEVAPDQIADATFRLSQTISTSVGSAQGSFPNYAGGEGGDIWFGRSEQPYYEVPEKGNWGYSTILHEIGHTLGLKHGQSDYSSEDISSIFDGVTAPFYGTQALEYDKDGQAWSVMTYTGGPNGVTSFEGEGQNQAQSYMQYDIAALQYLYGADFATRAGDTVYRWDAATGEGFVDGVGQGRPAGNVVFETIWDGGGIDTYDLSNYDGGISVDLRPGAFSTFSTAQLADNNAYIGGPLPAVGNVGNALLYQGDVRSLIENAIGGAGDDRLIGNQLANVLAGNAGDDVLAGGAGNDTLIGDAGNDIADFTGATAGITVTIDAASPGVKVVNGVDVDTLIGIEGVVGTAFDDRLTGDAGANTLSGGAGGRDVLRGGAGDDTLIGGGYTLVYRDEADIVRGPDAANRSLATAILLDDSFDLVDRATVSTAAAYPGAALPHATVVAAAAGSEGVDYYRFTATAGSRALFDIDATNGYTGMEILDADGIVVARNFQEKTTDDGSRQGYDARLAYVFQTGGTFYVRVTGSTYDAQPRDLAANQAYTLHVSLEHAATAAPVIRQTGSAVLDGGTGDDTLIATAGDDRIDGGAGVDTLSYANHFRGVTVALATKSAQDTNAGRDTIVNVENLTGSRFDDRLTGDGGGNVIDGGGGSDTLAGGAGIDTLSFASQTDAVTVSLADQGVAQTYRLGELVTASGFENLTGTGGNDRLSGDERANTIDGGAGDDVLVADARGRIGARDLLIGGAGIDTASFAAFTAGMVASIREDGRGIVTSGFSVVADLRDIENLTGGSGADTLFGNAGSNVLIGGAGNDALSGGGGDDRLTGGAGDDLLNGGTGNDTAVFEGAIDTTVDLALTGAQATGHGRDRLVGIENVATGSGNDVVRGDDGDNVFTDGGGTDSYDGRGGFDTLNLASATRGLMIDLSITAEQDTGGAGVKRISGIEALVGGAGVDYLIGSAGGNRIDGGRGDDILIGGLGRDTIDGGEGNDVVVGDSLNVADAVSGAAAGDILSGGNGADFVFGGAGDDVLDGGAGDDVLSNGTFASTVTVDAFGVFYDRGSLIRADGGNDTIDGGAGNDFAILAYNGRAEGVFVDVRDPDARTSILAGGVAVGTIAGIEKLGFEGGAGDDVVYGGGGYDFIATNGGNDFVDAGLGDDTVFAGSGDDVYDGGGGIDVLSFADATSDVTFDVMRTEAQDTGGGGRITARNFETVLTSRFGDTIRLSDRPDDLRDTVGGNDSFYGRGGDDRIFISRLGSERNTLLIDGGDGNDNISLLASAVQKSIVMNGGNGNDTIVIVGSDTATVDAGADDDYVGFNIGTAGVYGAFTLTLGAGADDFSFDIDRGAVATDRTNTIITDFSAAEDTLLMSRLLNTKYDPNNNYDAYQLLTGYAEGDDPFRTGHYVLKQDGSSTLLQIDLDGTDGPIAARTLLTLQNVDAATLTSANFRIAPNDRDSTLIGDPGWALVTPRNGTDAGETLGGNDGRDILSGLSGNDVLAGLGGDDVLYGGSGDDVLDGGAGRDLLFGGSGNDRFVFSTVAEADGDGVRGFETGDLIDLTGIGDSRFTWIGGDDFGKIAGELQVRQADTGLYIVAGDIDGDGVADFTMTVQSNHALAIADVLL